MFGSLHAAYTRAYKPGSIYDPDMYSVGVITAIGYVAFWTVVVFLLVSILRNRALE